MYNCLISLLTDKQTEGFSGGTGTAVCDLTLILKTNQKTNV